MPVFIPAMTEPKALPQDIIIKENQIREILRKADSNGDGRLSKEDLKKAFKELGFNMPGWRACRLLRRADANCDGVLTMEELNPIVDFALARYKFRK